MATDLFFWQTTQGSPGIRHGDTLLRLDGSASTNWDTRLARDSRPGTGSSVSLNTATVNGPTSGIECGPASDWLSAPLAADVTISGTITLNLYGSENSMSANVAINAKIDRVRPDGTITQIAKSANVTELGTTSGVFNFTVTPTSTACLKGDRLRLIVFGDDSTGANMASGFTFTFIYGATSAASSGDSWIRFTENLTFMSTTPAGSQLFLRATTGPAVNSADEREMWTSRGASSTTATVNTVSGMTNPVQWTASAGGSVIEWYTRPLTAFTLSDLVYANIRLGCSNTACRVGPRLELAVCDGDGTNVTVLTSWVFYDQASMFATPVSGNLNGELTTTADDDRRTWFSVPTTSVADGQRLRLRMYADDCHLPQVSGHTAFVSFDGPTASAAGDSYITLSQSVTEFSGSGAVGKSLQAVWNTRAPLGDTLQGVWGVRTPVNDSLQSVWAVRTRLGDTLQAVWNTKASLGDTLQAVWNVRRTQADTLQSVWGVRTPVPDQLQSVWAVRTRVNDQLQAVWNTKAAVGDTVQAVWNTRAVLGDTLQGVWGVRTPVADQLQAVWAVRTRLGDQVQAVWHVKAALGDQLQGVWGVRTSVFDTLQAVWNVQIVGLEAVGKDLQAVWSVRAVQGDQLQGVWSVRTPVSDTLQSVWGVRTRVSDQLQTVWHDRAVVSDQLQAVWGVRARVFDTLQSVWAVRTSQGDTLQSVWHVRSALGDQVVAVWHTRARVGDTVQAVWNVEVLGASAVGKSLTVIWNDRAAVADTLQAVWGVRTRVSDQLQAVWSVRTPLGDQLQAVWRTRAVAGDQLQAVWNVKAPVFDTLQAQWGVRTRAADQLTAPWAVRTSAGDTLQALWQARAIAGDDLTVVWNVLSFLLPVEIGDAFLTTVFTGIIDSRLGRIEVLSPRGVLLPSRVGTELVQED